MIRIIGKENVPDRPVIFVSNHPCSTDVWIAPFLFRRTKVLISEGFKIPILSQILSILGHVNCSKVFRKQAIRSCINQISKGNSIWIFPEGKLTEDCVGLFYNGYAKLQNCTDLEIIPIILLPEKIYTINKNLKLAFKYIIVVGKPTRSAIDIKNIIEGMLNTWQKL